MRGLAVACALILAGSLYGWVTPTATNALWRHFNRPPTTGTAGPIVEVDVLWPNRAPWRFAWHEIKWALPVHALALLTITVASFSYRPRSIEVALLLGLLLTIAQAAAYVAAEYVPDPLVFTWWLWKSIVIAATATAPLGLIWALAARWLTAPYWRARYRRQGSCADCGYDLRGNLSGRCPECGTAVPTAAGTSAT
jgi:hypothetical protein